jgi:hypothetical protein
MMHPRLLLMAPQREDLFAVGRALRDAGYLVFPARYHELAADAITRVRPDLVLIDAEAYPRVESDECRDAVKAVGSRVVLFARVPGAGSTAAHVRDGAGMQQLRDLPYPVVEYSGDARALAALIEESARSQSA